MCTRETRSLSANADGEGFRTFGMAGTLPLEAAELDPTADLTEVSILGRLDRVIAELSDTSISHQRFVRLAAGLGMSIPALLLLMAEAETPADSLPSSGILIERNGESVDAPAQGGD